jgi:predicted RNase H-like HicB family nuclease
LYHINISISDYDTKKAGPSSGLQKTAAKRPASSGITGQCPYAEISAYVEWDPKTKLYVGTVPGIPGAHTQATSLDELQKNLQEVLELCLEEEKISAKELPRFVGLQQIQLGL